MIRKIYLENFRSIINQRIELKPLTVIVGANNSGKSNLIKAIDFIGNLSIYGLQKNVRNYNGFYEIIPKLLSKTKIKNTNCVIGAEFNIPTGFKDEERELICNYELSFTGKNNSEVKIKKEKTKLTNILWYTSKLNKSKKQYKRDSSISIEVTNKKKNIASDPGPTKNNIDLFMDWMFPSATLGTIAEFKKIGLSRKKQMVTLTLLTLLKPLVSEKKISVKELSLKELMKTETDYDTIFNTSFAEISNHFLKVREALSNINRYDLLINALRSEQSVSHDKILNLHGSNLPSVLEDIYENKPEAWNRIIETISTISPSVKKVNYKKFPREKRYVEFEEIFGGRPVESWESSDGTLRALAILTALESQNPFGTVLVEEPEIGLHPWAMKPLIDHMRELIEKNNIQVILTTHSDQILENVNRDELLICSRIDEKGTVFEKLEDISPNSDENMKDIGRKWRQGLIGGVPECV